VDALRFFLDIHHTTKVLSVSQSKGHCKSTFISIAKFCKLFYPAEYVDQVLEAQEAFMSPIKSLFSGTLIDPRHFQVSISLAILLSDSATNFFERVPVIVDTGR
jgi:hypothetical protein